MSRSIAVSTVILLVALATPAAGSAEANGTYSFDPAGRPRDKDTLACHLGIYVHNTNPACWIGYQDCRKFQHADWNK